MTTKQRLQVILDALSARDMNDLGFYIDDNAAQLMVQFLDEVVEAVVEEACLLTEHRSAQAVDVPDIKKIFAKRFGVTFSS